MRTNSIFTSVQIALNAVRGKVGGEHLHMLMLMLTLTLILTLTLTLLSGCSATQRHYYDLLESAFFRPDDVELTLDQVRQSPVDLIYVRVGKQSRATMALAFIEGERYKWVSNDLAMLVLVHGRIVKTIGFETNLLYVSDLADDPLRASDQSGEGMKRQWSGMTDWDSAFQSGVRHHSTFEEIGVSDMNLFGQNFKTRELKETLLFADTGQHVENHFWFDQETAVLVASRQQIAPHWPPVEIIHLSQLARVLGQRIP
jgi:hypothetical protein